MEKTAFVEELVKHMKQEDMEKAFCFAAITGNVKIAELLLKNENLLWIRDQNDMLPMQLASSAGHVQMIEFLFKKTSEELLKQKLSFPDIKKLLFFTINNNIDCKLMHISFAYLTVVCYDAIFFLRMCSSINSGHMTAVTSKLLRISKKFVDEERLTAWERHDQCEFSQSLNTLFF